MQCDTSSWSTEVIIEFYAGARTNEQSHPYGNGDIYIMMFHNVALNNLTSFFFPFKDIHPTSVKVYSE